MLTLNFGRTLLQIAWTLGFTHLHGTHISTRPFLSDTSD